MSVTTGKSLVPTRKWFASAVGGLASIAATWIVSGAFDGTEKGMAATLLVGLVAAYFQPNQEVPAGVPRTARRRSYGTG